MALTSTTLLFNNSAGRLLEDARGFLRVTWHPGVISSAERYELLNELLRALERSGCGKVLGDQRYMPPLTPAEQAWVAENWTPRAVSQGLYRHRAILTARDVAARRSIAGGVTLARGHINYCYFDNETEAIAWLLAQR
jgi:hypothetical protein